MFIYLDDTFSSATTLIILLCIPPISFMLYISRMMDCHPAFLSSYWFVWALGAGLTELYCGCLLEQVGGVIHWKSIHWLYHWGKQFSLFSLYPSTATGFSDSHGASLKSLHYPQQNVHRPCLVMTTPDMALWMEQPCHVMSGCSCPSSASDTVSTARSPMVFTET